MTLFKGSKYTYIAVFSVNIVGFLAGTALSWTSPILPKLKNDSPADIPLGRRITSDEESWIGSLTSLGGVFGPFLFPYILEKLGRKPSAAVCSLPFLIAYLMAAFSKNIVSYYISRFLMGVGIGGVFTVAPIYIVEVVEVKNRGILTASTTTFILGGCLFAYILGPYVSIMAFNLVLAGIAVVFLPLLYYFSPETPFFLMNKDEEASAKESLRYLRRKSSKALEIELEIIGDHVKQLKRGNVLDLIRNKAARKAFVISVALTTFQQFSGINVILAYTQIIFEAGKTDIPSDICSIIVGFVQFVACFMTPMLTERAGRRKLLMISISGSTVALAVLGLFFYLKDHDFNVDDIFWLPLFCLIMYIVFYGCGMGCLPWAIMPEIMPLDVISTASTLIASFYWVSGFFLTKYFGEVSDSIGMGPTFWIFAGCCVVFVTYVFIFLFETKGKTLQEIQNHLNS